LPLLLLFSFAPRSEQLPCVCFLSSVASEMIELINNNIARRK
jgi:hypothetical protein